MGLFSGFEKLGLGNLSGADLYGKEEKAKEKAVAVAKEKVEIQETDCIYEKKYKCPVCDSDFSAKIMKSGRTKLIGTDFDLRPKYDGIAAEKYDVLLCDRCGYAALGRYFTTLLPAQCKMIKEQITANIELNKYNDEIYTFKEALERYQIALACAIVKKAKASEKAYICLKTAWVLRALRESVEAGKDKYPEGMSAEDVTAQEEEYLRNAYTGFIEARQSESFPMAGMDQTTVDYLLAQLAFHLKEFDVAAKMVQALLTSPGANSRIKDKARDLKDEIVAAKKAAGT